MGPWNWLAPLGEARRSSSARVSGRGMCIAGRLAGPHCQIYGKIAVRQQWQSRFRSADQVAQSSQLQIQTNDRTCLHTRPNGRTCTGL